MINGLSASALVSWQRSNRVKNDRKPGFWHSLRRVCSAPLKPGNKARHSRTIFQGIFPFWAEVIGLPFGWITCGILETNLEILCTQWEVQKYYASKTRAWSIHLRDRDNEHCAYSEDVSSIFSNALSLSNRSFKATKPEFQDVPKEQRASRCFSRNI